MKSPIFCFIINLQFCLYYRMTNCTQIISSEKVKSGKNFTFDSFCIFIVKKINYPTILQISSCKKINIVYNYEVL